MTTTYTTQLGNTRKFDDLVEDIFQSAATDQVLSAYSMENGKAVSDFLDKNRNLIQYLEIAPAKIKEYFGGKVARLSLKVMYDPEVEPEYDHGTLFINVSSKGSLKSLMAKLDSLTWEWLLKIPAKDRLYFEVDLDFA